ncbi:MAG: glycine cleavage system aminomethyltransferase GcvT [bacterium]|nr:glycine cleavage system aminomethyltransferase GcvT [bacterium]
MTPDVLSHTPLHDAHCARGARMAPFAGWLLPIYYSSIIEEHLHTRAAATLFDTCHMGQFLLKGPNAARDLDRLLTCNITSLPVGRCRYGLLLNDRGTVLDDSITYRLSHNEFMIVVNAATTQRDARWIAAHCSSGTSFEDISPITAKFDLQGPLAADILQPHLSEPLNSLTYFSFLRATLHGVDVLISRTGYTGEYGFELYVAAPFAIPVWNLLLEDPRLKPAGLGARDTLRLECALPLYGHELTEDRSPAFANLDFAISAEKDFIGKNALDQARSDPSQPRLCGLSFPTRQSPRAGHPVLHNGSTCGVITSASFAPSLGHAIALAYLDPACASCGTHVQVSSGRALLDAVVCPLPFYQHGTARRPTVTPTS